MATTNAKPGFRLPWSADRGESESPADASTEDGPTGDPATQAQENETPEMIDAALPATDPVAVDAEEPAAPVPTPDLEPTYVPTPPPAARKPNKFMAELTKAMQAAAETAREETLARFASEAKAHIENIHTSTTSEATDLRKKADDDVAAIREWSKVEIARIREETDERIAHRKTVLEREIEAHAGEIEYRVELVQKRVAGFEAEMAAFFERLLAEDDPTRFASLAESLPESPPFDPDQAWEPVGLIGDTPEATVADAEPEATEPLTDDPTTAAEATDGVATDSDADAPTEGVAETGPDSDVATAETASPEVAIDDAGDPFSIGEDDQAAAVDVDPRLTALGINPDFAAAEAEAATFTTEAEAFTTEADPFAAEAERFAADAAGADDEIPVIGDDALAARLAGLVPDGDSAGTESTSTRVIVTGLVSVASIAGFKRHLSRLSGVHSVGVSSGPDGEFIFAIVHDGGLALGDAIAMLPGFSSRVTGESDGELTVSARDPETEG